MVPAAMVGQAALQLGGNLIQGYYANQASERQAKSAQDALNFKKMVWNETKQQYEPYIEAGARGLTGYEDRISNLTAPTYDYQKKDFNFQTNLDPGAQYRMDQAKKAIEASMASKGQSLGSGVLKSLQTRSQDMASQEFDKSFNRYQTQEAMDKKIADDNYARQMGFKTQDIQNYKDLTGFGTQGIQGTYGASQGIGDSMLQVGQAEAYGDINKANMFGNTAQMLGKGYSDYLLEMEKQNKAKS